MKDKITLKEFFDSEEILCIHCNTEEKATKLLKEFDKLGKKWCTGISYLECNEFDEYMDKTCYSNNGTFCEIEFLKDENYKIYSFEDIIFEEEAKPKNLIPEIAKMLGVEIGEEFFVVEQGYAKYKLDLKHGLMYFDEFGDRWIAAGTLNDWLLNINTIKKLPKKPQLTDAERVILENLPKEYKWIARDSDDELSMFNHKPFKREYTESWGLSSGVSLSLEAFKHLFQFIKWEDDNAYNIKELLKGEK